MASQRRAECVCAKCGKRFEVQAYSSVEVDETPEGQALKEKVVCGELFIRECPGCGNRFVLREPFVYCDRSGKLLICITDSPIKAGTPDGWTARIVPDVGSLIEKIKIFDAGLDDIAVELCKFVTVSELGKDVRLKFLQLEGADNDMVFSYPGESGMEMLSVGFNVYEDSRGILSRNPAMSEDVAGLSRVDADWLAKFIR